MECTTDNDYDGRLGLRISAVFVILLGSFLGAWFPTFAKRHRGIGVPSWAFFAAKYFGSGVILATAMIHLLAPATEALTNPCLTGPITAYPWAQGICLMAFFALFFVELMTMRYARFGHDHDHDHGHAHAHRDVEQDAGFSDISPTDSNTNIPLADQTKAVEVEATCPAGPHVPGDDHLSHSRAHRQESGGSGSHSHNTHSPQREERTFDPESYVAQMTAIFILEFGVVFHSIFIGLTLAVAGAEFITLYVVLAFHQTFEGLGLGARLAAIDWPKSKQWTPYLLATGFAVSTPIALAVGLGFRTSLAPGSQTNLIVNGIFDSISAGILIYTGLVELMAHEFMFSSHMQKAPIREVLAAVGLMVLGAALMALLGKWA